MRRREDGGVMLSFESIEKELDVDTAPRGFRCLI
jgi:hypothetical protein